MGLYQINAFNFLRASGESVIKQESKFISRGNIFKDLLMAPKDKDITNKGGVIYGFKFEHLASYL